MVAAILYQFITTVVGVMKRPPALMGKRLIRTELYATMHGAVQLADTINFFFLRRDSSVWYKYYVMKYALDCLRKLGVAPNHPCQELTDAELHLRG